MSRKQFTDVYTRTEKQMETLGQQLLTSRSESSHSPSHLNVVDVPDTPIESSFLMTAKLQCDVSEIIKLCRYLFGRQSLNVIV